MLARIKNAALSVVGASSNRPDRERLKAAISARDAAHRVVAESRETVERLQSVLDRAYDLAKIASAAASKASEACSTWVRIGCRHSESHALQALDDAAAQAARAAESAGRDADAVNKMQTLARAQDAHRSAETDVRGAEDGITAAIAVIIAAEAAPLLARFEQAAADYRQLRAGVMHVRAVLVQPWDLTTKNKMNPAWEGEQAVEVALNRAVIQSWDRERNDARAHDVCAGERGRDEAAFEQLASKWRDRAAQLRAYPDA